MQTAVLCSLVALCALLHPNSAVGFGLRHHECKPLQYPAWLEEYLVYSRSNPRLMSAISTVITEATPLVNKIMRRWSEYYSALANEAHRGGGVHHSYRGHHRPTGGHRRHQDDHQYDSNAPVSGHNMPRPDSPHDSVPSRPVDEPHMPPMPLQLVVDSTPTHPVPSALQSVETQRGSSDDISSPGQMVESRNEEPFSWWKPWYPSTSGGGGGGADPFSSDDIDSSDMGVDEIFCVGCDHYADAIGGESAALTRESACVGLVDQVLDEPLSARQMMPYLVRNYYSAANANDPTPDLLMCCHALFHRLLMPGASETTYPLPKLPAGKTCTGLVDELLKAVKKGKKKIRIN